MGDLSLPEWFEEFEQLTAQFNLSSTEKARLLLDHLAGAAREEVMCLQDDKRHDFVKLLVPSNFVLFLQINYNFPSTQASQCEYVDPSFIFN